MVFNSQTIALLVSLIWLIILTILLTKMYTHYNNLTKDVHKKNLTSVLDHLLSELSVVKKGIEILVNRCDKIEKDGALHIQKVGLLRFNPFKDTGGDQSFILALVDGNDTGVVVSGLYSRSGTRWYAKRVVLGKGVEYELSDEEKKAIKQARITELN